MWAGCGTFMQFASIVPINSDLGMAATEDGTHAWLDFLGGANFAGRYPRDVLRSNIQVFFCEG